MVSAESTTLTERQVEVLELREQGQTQQELADHFGTTDSNINGKVGLLVVVTDGVVWSRSVFESERLKCRPDECIFNTTLRELTKVATLKSITTFDDIIESVVNHPAVKYFEQVDDVSTNIGDALFDFS
jgi:Uncharacterized protein conserved in archaea